MNNDQNILEDAYYKCVEVVRGVVKEVLADLDDMENAYVAAIMKALGKWQESGAKALQAMHTASAKEWDELHSELVRATVEFRNACMEAETIEANGLAEVSRKIASGARKDPATDILERALQKTRKVVDDAAETYLKALKDSWLGMVSSQQLPTLVASSYGVLMTFRTAIWHLISDESVWPSRLRSAGFCKMAPIVRQSLASIPALCGLVVPPRPAEAPATPPSPVQSYLMGKRSTAASPQASLSGYGSGGSTPSGTPTVLKKAFGALPQPSSSPMGPPATAQPLLSPIPDPRGLACCFTCCCWVQPTPRAVRQYSISESGNTFGHCSLQGGARPSQCLLRWPGRGHSGSRCPCRRSKFLHHQPLQRSSSEALTTCGCTLEGQR